MAFVPALALLIAIAAAGVCGMLALPILVSQTAQLRNRSRLQGQLIGVDSTGSGRRLLMESALRNGIRFLRPVSTVLLRLPWLQSRCRRSVEFFALKGFVCTAETICELQVAAAILIFLFMSLLTKVFVVALGAVLVCALLFQGRIDKACAQSNDRLVEQIPDVLRSLGICFSAGYSLQQAFEQTALDTPDPLGAQMRQTSYDVNAGKSIEEALAALEQRTLAADLRFVLVALEIQHRTGGSLQDLLDSVADSVVATADLRRQLSVQTAQARLSAKVVTILPLVLVAALSLAMDGYLAMFFSSTEGLMILFTALAMEGLGIVAIRRILGVDLD